MIHTIAEALALLAFTSMLIVVGLAIQTGVIS